MGVRTKMSDQFNNEPQEAEMEKRGVVEGEGEAPKTQTKEATSKEACDKQKCCGEPTCGTDTMSKLAEAVAAKPVN
jgi:hypothetical protein